MIERCVRNAGGTYLCCDTDALIIVASKKGGWVKMPYSTPRVKALSWKELEQITYRFDSLSPYNRKDVPHLLTLTDENYDKMACHGNSSEYRYQLDGTRSTPRNVANHVAVIASASLLLIPKPTV